MKEYSLELLQYAYLPVTLRKEKGEVCGYCWRSKKNCSCDSNYDVTVDSFLNLPVVDSKYL